jgi:hypothetical protein
VCSRLVEQKATVTGANVPAVVLKEAFYRPGQFFDAWNDCIKLMEEVQNGAEAMLKWVYDGGVCFACHSPVRHAALCLSVSLAVSPTFVSSSILPFSGHLFVPLFFLSTSPFPRPTSNLIIVFVRVFSNLFSLSLSLDLLTSLSPRRAYSGPVLFVNGERDSRDRESAWVAAAQRAQVKVVSGAPHLMLYDPLSCRLLHHQVKDFAELEGWLAAVVRHKVQTLTLDDSEKEADRDEYAHSSSDDSGSDAESNVQAAKMFSRMRK